MSQNPLMPIAPITAAAATPLRTSTRFTPLDPLRVLRQYIWLLIIAAVVGVGLGTVSAILCEQFIPEYTSEARMLVSGELENIYAQAADPTAAAGDIEAMRIFMRNLVYRMGSEEILDVVLKDPNVRKTEWFQSFSDTRDAFEYLREHLNARNLAGSTLIQVQVTGSLMDDLSVILETVTKELLRAYVRDLQNRDSDVRIMMVKERRRAEEERDRVQEELDAFKDDHEIAKLHIGGTDADLRYKTLSEKMTLLQVAAGYLKQQYNELVTEQQSAQTHKRPEQIASQDRHPKIARLKQQVHTLKQSNVFLLDSLGPNHRSIQQIGRNLEMMESEINRQREEIVRQNTQILLSGRQKQIEQIYNQITTLSPLLNEAAATVRDLGTKIDEYERIEVRLDIATKRRERAEKLLEDMRVRFDRPDNVRVNIVQSPTVAELTFPNYPAMIIGMTMLLVALTAGIVFLKELLDQRIKSPSDLQLLPGATLLGVLPVTTEDPSGPTAVEGVVAKDPTGLIAEAFRQTRTEILARMDRRGYKTLMLVGAQAGCGTSVVTSNLATSITFNSQRVLIIDANFRRPNQCKLLGAATTPGLVEVLKGEASIDEALVHNDDPRLDLLPAGDGMTTPPEILDSEDFRNLLTQFENDYDVVLIDAPPVLVASDSRLLCKQVDAVALVVRAKSEKRGMISRMIGELEGHRADILGVILNSVHSSAGGYFRKNYEAFYRYRQPNGRMAGRRETAAESAATES